MGLERASRSLDAFRLFAREGGGLALLRAAWPLAVGGDLGRRTEVLAIEGKTLRVRVPDARWRKELHRLQKDILGRLRTIIGDSTPKRLAFTEGAVPACGAERAERQDSLSVQPAAREVPSAVQAGAEAIGDPEIRARFLETARRYLNRVHRA